MPTTKATLAGVPILVTDDIGWNFTKGFQPYQRTFEFDPAGYQSVMNAAKGLGAQGDDRIQGVAQQNMPGAQDGGIQANPINPNLQFFSGQETTRERFPVNGLELRVEVDGRPPLVVKDVIVIGDAPASEPYLRAVVATDRRWLWARKVVERSYNIRRRSGQRRWVPTAAGAEQIVDMARTAPIDDVDFALYSLKPDRSRWKASEVILDVLNEVTAGKFYFDDTLIANELPVEGIELLDPGDSALSRVFSLIPGLNIYMNSDGVATVTSDYSLDDLTELNSAPHPVAGKPIVEYVDLSLSRPKAIDVFFEIEEEYRFDFTESTTPTSTTDDTPYLENVMPLPDPVLAINGKDYAQGTFVRIDSTLLSAWHSNRPPTFTFQGRTRNLPEFTMQVLKDTWFAGGYNLYFEAGIQDDALWARRMTALQQHYRQTFRINKRWTDRLRAIRPFRASIIDPETGTRAPADVYANYSQIPSFRRVAQLGSDQTKLMAWQITGYSTTLASGKKAPAIIDVLDEQQGVFRVNYRPDAWGDSMQMVPSLVAVRSDLRTAARTTVPSSDPRDGVPLVMVGGCGLTDDHQLAAVMTATPAAPANVGRLLRVRVEANQARLVMPPRAEVRMGECNGPPWEVRVGPGVVTARFLWRDDARQEIINAVLGLGARNVERLQNKEDIEGVAKAVAAAIYTGLVDRYEGTHVTAIDPARRPVGRSGSVSHVLAVNGEGLTFIDFPPDIKPFDFYALLPESVRRILTRAVVQQQ